MKHWRVKSKVGRPFAGRIALVAAVMVLCACSAGTPRNVDLRTCLDTVPRDVKGLQVVQGPRTEASIILDMVPAVCYAQNLFRQLWETGETKEGGTVVFRISVEYTGEVYEASVAETTIDNERFLRTVSDLIMDTDFVPWTRHDTDTVLRYPMTFPG